MVVPTSDCKMKAVVETNFERRCQNTYLMHFLVYNFLKVCSNYALIMVAELSRG